MLRNGTYQSGPFQVSPGNLLYIECDIDWQVSAQYLGVEYPPS